MEIEAIYAWIALLGLGGAHGLNPGMGWLFAVSLGLQRESRGAVWSALGPLAAGHALAVAVVVGAAMVVGLAVPPHVLEWMMGASLVSLGFLHLARHRHSRLAGMRVGARDLLLWSFLMASGHGAGLMALPIALDAGAVQVLGRGQSGAVSRAVLQEHGAHLAHAELVAAGAPLLEGLLPILIHTLGYLLVTGLVAVVVYEKVGLRMLRRAWINVDLIWAGALLVTGAVTLLA